MGKNKESKTKSRRDFFSSLLSETSQKRGEMVKMLTPDGKLVEVERSVLEQAARKKASNKDIYDWMQNPSKKDN